MKKIIAACVFAAVFGAAPAIAADTSTNNQPSSSTSSGPGVKGAPGSKNGPAMDANGSGNSGAGSGEQGMSPSQDATGVKGAQDSTNGPSNKKPGNSDTSK